MGAVFIGLAQESFTEKLCFEWRLEASEGMSLVDVWGKSFLGWEQQC